MELGMPHKGQQVRGMYKHLRINKRFVINPQ